MEPVCCAGRAQTASPSQGDRPTQRAECFVPRPVRCRRSRRARSTLPCTPFGGAMPGFIDAPACRPTSACVVAVERAAASARPSPSSVARRRSAHGYSRRESPQHRPLGRRRGARPRGGKHPLRLAVPGRYRRHGRRRREPHPHPSGLPLDTAPLPRRPRGDLLRARRFGPVVAAHRAGRGRRLRGRPGDPSSTWRPGRRTRSSPGWTASTCSPTGTGGARGPAATTGSRASRRSEWARRSSTST